MDPTTQTEPSRTSEGMTELQAEALKRIEEMESPGYVFPPAFRRSDWIGVGVVIVGMFALILVGYWM